MAGGAELRDLETGFLKRQGNAEVVPDHEIPAAHK
jgi:hypothetical protein